jgi:hypothetical protein
LKSGVERSRTVDVDVGDTDDVDVDNDNVDKTGRTPFSHVSKHRVEGETTT